MRQRPRTDGNQKRIVSELRQAGASVAILSAIGHGVPDLLVGMGGHTLPVEIKLPGEALTEAEARWHDEWHGSKLVATTTEEIIMKFQEMTNHE